jgi:hypothetical protein
MTEPRIGTLNEKSLHAALKNHLAQPGDLFEVEVDGYVIDIVRGDTLIEVQTGNFSSIRTKVFRLVQRHPFRLVYPIAREKWIVKNPVGTSLPETRRKSPKQGQLTEIFNELVAFPEVFFEPNFSLELLLVQEQEVRRYIGKRRWRSRGWATEERQLLQVLESHLFQGPQSLLRLVPENLPSQFTTLEFGKVMGESRRLAQRAAYCLRRLGIIQQVGKQGRAHLYSCAMQ